MSPANAKPRQVSGPDGAETQGTNESTQPTKRKCSIQVAVGIESQVRKHG